MWRGRCRRVAGRRARRGGADPAWRGRGVATALIGRNLRLLAERGMTEAALLVDSQNPTGALALYERVGFRRVRTDMFYQRPA